MAMSSIAIFTRSPEVALLQHLITDPDWTRHPDAASLLDLVCSRAAALDLFTTRLADIQTDLAAKNLAPEIWYRDQDGSTFDKDVQVEIKSCVLSAYGRMPQAADIESSCCAALIREGTRDEIVASALMNFCPWPDKCFRTKMEAVRKDWQRKKVATALFKFIELVVEYLMNTDVYVQLNLLNGPVSTLETLKGHDLWRPLMQRLAVATCMVLEACVDPDAPEWHRMMMERTLGFEYDSLVVDDLVFVKDVYSVPPNALDAQGHVDV